LADEEEEVYDVKGWYAAFSTQRSAVVDLFACKLNYPVYRPSASRICQNAPNQNGCVSGFPCTSVESNNFLLNHR
jgi:hypothetical protein